MPDPSPLPRTQVVPSDASSFSPPKSVAERFVNKVSTKYFVFYSNIPRDKLFQYADFSQRFLELIDREFIQIETKFPMNAFVLEDRVSCQRFLKEEMQIDRPPLYGMWLPGRNAVVTYDGAGLGTFAHEIMHPVVEQSLKSRPPWAMEGIPAFFEKVFGYKRDNQLVLTLGYQNPWRIRQLSNRLTSLKLAQIISDPKLDSESESEQRLVSVFLFQHGKMEAIPGVDPGK